MCENIQTIDHRSDILQSEIYDELNKMEHLPFNHFVAIQISHVVYMIETITDRVEDVADYIEVLKAAKK